MKPTFALNLSHDSVGLLHRTPRGWMPVGDVAFASPSLADDLGAIRTTALGLSPKGITTKLVIPNSEILYIEVEAPGPDAATRRRQIRSALKGKTPYDVEELVFDWWGKGPAVQVAVIWKGTLEEAEAFADEHRFNPVSFVAIPDEGRFKGEPWFGMTKVAATILSAGEKVERDQDPVTVLARDVPKSEAPVVAVPPPASQPLAAPAPAPTVVEAPSPPPAASVAAPAAPVAPQPAAPQPAAPPPVAVAPPDPAPPEPAPRPEPQRAPPPEQPPAEPAPAPPPQEIADPPPAEVPDFDPPSETFPEVSARPAPAQHLSARITPSVIVDEAVDEAPMALDVPETADPAGDTSAEADLPPPPSAAAMAAFASRRTATDSGAVRPAPAVTRPPIPGGLAGARPPVERPAAARPAPRITAEGLASRPVAASAATRPSTLSPPAKPHVRPEPSAKVVKGLGGTVSAPVPPAGRKVRASDAAGLAETAASDAGTTPTTQAAKPSRAPANAFGTRPPLPQRGKPRYLGLVLTLILLFLMALVAAWSSFYLTSAEQESATVASTVEPDMSEADLAALSAAEAEADGEAIETMAPDTAEALAPAAPPEETPTAVAADLPAEPAPPVEAAAEPADANLPETAAAEAGPAEPAAAPEPEQEVAAAAAPEPEPAPQSEPAPETLVGTEAASAPAMASEPQDEIFLAAMDRPPVTADPAALTVPSRGNDALPPAQLPPPPFGTVYRFDADGLIIPTPEGIMTPEGVLLVAGPPAILPPERPASIAPVAAPAATEPAAEPTVAAAPGALANPEAGVAASALVPADPAVDPFVADPELAGSRPRLRPEGLVPPAAAAGDDASLAPAADSRFASLRPRERSPAVVSAAVAAEAALAAASTAAVAAAEPQSPLIVAVSRKPAPRPRDLSRAVEAAVAAAVRAPDPVPQAEPEPEPQQVVAAVAPAPAKPSKPAKPADPEEEDEPDVDTSRDRSPALKGTVAKQATFVNALNMSKLSLIGVYGTQSQRYALVREPTGRYRKVKVGDRIDGGKVAAITANEVRYQKGGRMVTLAMPRD